MKKPSPQTLEEVVDDLIANLSKKDKRTVRNTPKDDLFKFHFGLGLMIRNKYIYKGGKGLIEDIARFKYPDDEFASAFLHPDDFSAAICNCNDLKL